MTQKLVSGNKQSCFLIITTTVFVRRQEVNLDLYSQNPLKLILLMFSSLLDIVFIFSLYFLYRIHILFYILELVMTDNLFLIHYTVRFFPLTSLQFLLIVNLSRNILLLILTFTAT